MQADRANLVMAKGSSLDVGARVAVRDGIVQLAFGRESLPSRRKTLSGEPETVDERPFR
jgi:hypothetical protein